MGLLTRIFSGNDQDLFNNLTDQQKLAFCKLASIMAKADGKVIKTEMDGLPNIPMSFMANSAKLNYDDSILALKELSTEQKGIIHEELKDMSRDDGQVTIEEKDFLTKVKTGL